MWYKTSTGHHRHGKAGMKQANGTFLTRTHFMYWLLTVFVVPVHFIVFHLNRLFISNCYAHRNLVVMIHLCSIAINRFHRIVCIAEHKIAFKKEKKITKFIFEWYGVRGTELVGFSHRLSNAQLTCFFWSHSINTVCLRSSLLIFDTIHYRYDWSLNVTG